MIPRSIAIVGSSDLVERNGGSNYRYRPHSTVYYLTGISTEPFVAVFYCDESGKRNYWLFANQRNEQKVRWEGEKINIAEAEQHGFDHAFALPDLVKVLQEKTKDCKYCYFQGNADLHSTIKQIYNAVEVTPLEILVNEMRLIKHTSELRAMSQAGRVALAGHRACMEKARDGLGEYQLHALLLQEFYSHGMEEAYPSIVASGERACVLHYHDNNHKIKNGELVLIDAGAESNYYSSDITRVFPVSGKFTTPQRQVYELVLSAQNSAIEKATTAHTIADVHHAAVEVLCHGLIDLGILGVSFEEVIEKKLYLHYYMHGTSHWLGMDVHDPGDYQIDNQPRLLEVGMVITVEPGLYLNHPSVPLAFKNIGIRIEDDVAITNTAPCVISKGSYRTVDEIESLCVRD